MAFCYPRTKQTDLGRLLLISQAKAFLTDSKKSLRFSSLAAESGRKGMFVLRAGQCHGPQEKGSLKDSHAGPLRLPSQERFLVNAALTTAPCEAASL